MVGRKLGLLVFSCIVGCGGGAASGEGAATGGVDEPSESQAPDTSATGDEATPEETAEPTAGDEASSPEAASGSSEEATTALQGDDLGAVLQIVLKDPELVDHLHVNKPGRAPLKVSGENLPAKLKVVVGSHDVRVVDGPKSKKDPVLVFTKLERSGNEARVHYRFDVEGLKGRATLYLKNGRWELGANRVIEK